jgi:hypothetical protein
MCVFWQEQNNNGNLRVSVRVTPKQPRSSMPAGDPARLPHDTHHRLHRLPRSHRLRTPKLMPDHSVPNPSQSYILR